MPYKDYLMSPYSISIRQLFLTDEGIQAQRGKVTFSRQQSMGSVTTRREPVGEKRGEVERKRKFAFMIFLRVCLLSPKDVESNWLSHSPQFCQEEV